ncbi:hypothetical protein TNCV_2377811 [Trichonephila clavipes]|nr:hypothetical protein TNCV_2377811 [Trichonephila clavipes]
MSTIHPSPRFRHQSDCCDGISIPINDGAIVNSSENYLNGCYVNEDRNRVKNNRKKRNLTPGNGAQKPLQANLASCDGLLLCSTIPALFVF